MATDLNKATEALQLVTVQQDGFAIQYIKNPSEPIQLAAVQQNGYAVKFIETPSINTLCLALAKASSYRDQSLLKFCSKYLVKARKSSTE